VLLRGSHEDSKVNRLFGLAEECAVRMNENINDPNSVYNSLNRVFDLLPMGAVIEDKILCVHSGIGSLKTLA
jgi:protein phosphatase